MTCFLNGVRLTQVAAVRWATTPGIAPFTGTVFVEDSLLGSATADPRNATLKIGERTFQNLIILMTSSGTGTSEERLVTGVTLADRRYLLGTQALSVAFNLRRRTGDLTVGTGDEPIQVRPSIPQEAYYPDTLNNGQVWTIREALESVFDQAGFPAVTIPTSFPDFDLFGDRGYARDGTAAEIISDLMSFATGYEIGIKDNGELYVYDITDEIGELSQIYQMPQSLYGGGVVSVADRSFMRPSKVEVYFYAEAEIRFDFNHTDDQFFGLTSRVSPLLLGTDPQPALLESWASCPLQGLKLNGVVMARDSMVNLFSLYQALSDADANGTYPIPPLGKSSYGALSHHNVCYFYCQQWLADNSYAVNGSNTYDEYARVLRIIFDSFRRKFRLSRDWADRVAVVRANRVEYIDQISATRRPSPVFCDHMNKPAQRLSQTKTRSDYRHTVLVQQGSVSAVTANCKKAPASIRVVDQEAKALEVRFTRAPTGEVKDVLPAILIELPEVHNASNTFAKLSFGGPVLEDWELATILTCMPFQKSKSKSHLYKIEVTPDQAATALGIPAKRLGDCRGPIMQIIVEPGEQTTARFVWTDDKSQELRAPFFDPAAQFPESNIQDKPRFESIARSKAAELYLPMIDTLDGRATIPATGFAPRLLGTMRQVETVAVPDGIISTSAVFGNSPPQGNPYRYLPADVRKLLMRQLP